MTRLLVEFEVKDGKEAQFLEELRAADDGGAFTNLVGYRQDEAMHLRARPALQAFCDLMEAKLKKNDTKTTWREKPIEALFRLLLLEIEEFKVALEFFTIKEARPELVDIANFAMIVHDRLGMLDQDQNVKLGDHK